jgi:4-hydroxy-4-methyl-2-oxoglutarate aldolase
MAHGFEIYEEIPRPDTSLIERLLGIPTPDLGDVTFKRATMDPAIKPVYRPMAPAIGPAVTVSIPDGSVDVVKIAASLARPGDVLVINARGDMKHVVMGGNVARGLHHLGLAGAVIDGTVRDVTEMQEDGLSVFARGVGTVTGGQGGAGEINVPIACGGVVVNPGDIVVADEDGVAVIPPAVVDEVIERVRALHKKFSDQQPTLIRGEVPDLEQLRSTVAARGAAYRSGWYQGSD